MARNSKTPTQRAAQVKIIQNEIDWCEGASAGQTQGGELQAVNDAIIADGEKAIARSKAGADRAQKRRRAFSKP